jgi:hypothetical protein
VAERDGTSGSRGCVRSRQSYVQELLKRGSSTVMNFADETKAGGGATEREKRERRCRTLRVRSQSLASPTASRLGHTDGCMSTRGKHHEVTAKRCTAMMRQ